MLYQTSIPIESIDEDEFCDLVKRLAKMAGGEIEMEKQIIISTDSEDLSSILNSLADAIRSGDPSATVIRKTRKAKTKSEGATLLRGAKKERKKTDHSADGPYTYFPKHDPTRGPHVRSIKIESSGEMISRFELDKRLRERAIEPGTQLHSPRYGTMTVKNGVPSGEPYFVVNLVGEIISKGGDAQKE